MSHQAATFQRLNMLSTPQLTTAFPMSKAPKCCPNSRSWGVLAVLQTQLRYFGGRCLRVSHMFRGFALREANGSGLSAIVWLDVHCHRSIATEIDVLENRWILLVL